MEFFQRIIDILGGHKLIGPAADDDAILPGWVHLDDGVPLGSVAALQKRGVHAVIFQIITKDFAAGAQHPGV